MDARLIKGLPRLKTTLIVFSAALFLVFVRITYLTFFAFSAEERKPGVIRGPIFDRRGFVLAATDEASAIGISPRDIVDPEFTARYLSERLGMTQEEILTKLYQNQNRRYFLLKRMMDPLAADAIMELKLPGVHREGEYHRYYPGKSLAGNLLGFVGRDQDRALDGLERIFHDYLTSDEGEVNSTGPALFLTLDALIQSRLEEQLAKEFEATRSKHAIGIMMNVRTGEVLAMASYPNFDPNRYYASNPEQRTNWAIRLNYEPGSTVKIFMAAILLQEGVLHPGERFQCNGELHFYDSVVRCKTGTRLISHGSLTLEEIIQYSCNVGIIQAMQRIRKDRLYAYMHELGFGERTEFLVGGTEETSGYLPDLKNWVPSTGFYMPIGQGFSITPIQLLQAGASIANGGHLLRPYIADRIVSADGKVIFEKKERSRTNPFRPDVNRAVLRMMRRVVTGGTGRMADIPNLPVAGKTGTGQKSSARGYSENYVASFLGFFPAENPEFGILILFDDPGDLSGGTIAAPVFRRIVESIEPLISGSRVQTPLPRLRPLEPVNPGVNPSVIYDFRGLSARQAVDIASKYYKIPLKINGSGYVTRQRPAPGTSSESADKIELFLEAGE